mgnify:FL=1
MINLKFYKQMLVNPFQTFFNYTQKIIIPLFLSCSFFLAGCAMITIQIGGKISPYEEKTISGKGEDKILLIDISGVITGKSRSYITGIKKEPGMVERIKEQLNKAGKDKKIRAIILRVNTPGGTVTASDIIYHELLECKKKKDVKIIAAMMDLSTSGGYYISMSADKIIAHPTTITGSIGVLALKLNMKGLFEKIGIEDETVKSGGKKDITSPFRPFSEEEKKIFQEIIDSLFQNFVDVLKSRRKELSTEEIQKIADGRIYTAQQALKLKMIDKIGYLEDAIELAKKEAGLKEAKVITYHRPHQYKENIYSSNYQGAPHTVNILNIDMNSFTDRMGTKFMYIWMP